MLTKKKKFSRRYRFYKTKGFFAIIAILVIAAAGLGLRNWYNGSLGPVSSSKTISYYSVASGSSVHQIAEGLKQKNLIRSVRAFETYVKSARHNNSLQAGTYALSQSMSTPEVVDKMVKGDVAKDLVTILPGKTIKDIKQVFARAGYSRAEIEKAFNIKTYDGHPLLVYVPASATLEGLLYPDSFQKESTTPATAIVRQSMDEMMSHLTNDEIDGFAAQGLSVYQGLTMASIVYQESGSPDSQPTVAQVFLLRLKKGMALGSDVTAFYAASQAGAGKTLGVNSPYNTRIHTGIPPGPIGNYADTAIKAVAHPSNTDFLFFVAGDDGQIHFSHTEAEHEAATKKYCHLQCS